MEARAKDAHASSPPPPPTPTPTATHPARHGPRLLLAVWEMRGDSEASVIGYGATELPVEPGHFNLRVRTWRPEGTLVQRLQDLIIGGARTLTDTTEVLPPLEQRVASRYGLRTEPGADVHVRVQCVWHHRSPSEVRAAAEAAAGGDDGGGGGGGRTDGRVVGNSVADIIASLRTRSLAGTLRGGLRAGDDAGGARFAASQMMSTRRRDRRSPSPLRAMSRASGRRSPGSEVEGGVGAAAGAGVAEAEAGGVVDAEERARLRIARREARRARLRIGARATAAQVAGE